MQSAVEVLETIEELYRIVPHRTLIVVARSSSFGIWQDALYSHLACRSMLERWRPYTHLNSISVWDQVLFFF